MIKGQVIKLNSKDQLIDLITLNFFKRNDRAIINPYLMERFKTNIGYAFEPLGCKPKRLSYYVERDNNDHITFQIEFDKLLAKEELNFFHLMNFEILYSVDSLILSTKHLT